MVMKSAVAVGVAVLGLGAQVGLRASPLQAVSEVYVAAATVISGNGGAGSRVNCFSVPSLRPAEHGGTVTALSADGRVMTDSAATWADHQFNGANGPYYVVFESGPWRDITDTSAADHALGLAGSVGVVSVGEQYRIRRHWTVGGVFGPGNETGLYPGLNCAEADGVLLHDAATQRTWSVFYCSASGSEGWQYCDYRLAGAQVIPPAQGIMVQRKVPGDVVCYTSGVAGALSGQALPPDVIIQPGYNLVGTLRAAEPVALPELGLYTGDPATGVAGGSNPSEADNVIVVSADGSVVRYFYLTLPGHQGWYDAKYNPADAVLVEPGAAFFVQRKGGRQAFSWQVPAE